MITPLGKRVAVKRLEEKPPGMIETPDAYKEAGQLGQVVALGTGAPGFAFTVKVGETVLIPMLHKSWEYDHEAEKLMIISEENLLGVLDS